MSRAKLLEHFLQWTVRDGYATDSGINFQRVNDHGNDAAITKERDYQSPCKSLDIFKFPVILGSFVQEAKK